MVNFADAAKKKLADIERPPLPPVGSYRFQVSRLPSVSKSNDGVWEFLVIPCRAVEALTADMDDYKGAIESINLDKRFVFNTRDEVEFAKTEYQVRRFFEQHVACCSDDDTIAEAINACVGAQFIGDVVWKPDAMDPELFHANLTRTAPLD